MRKMNKKGFTIVELVIVIAVIAILSAVLIPTFSGVVANAKNTAAVSDAKAAYQQYLYKAAEEHKDPEFDDFIYEANGIYVVIKDGQILEVEGKNVFGTLDAAKTAAAFGADGYKMLEKDGTIAAEETADPDETTASSEAPANP